MIEQLQLALPILGFFVFFLGACMGSFLNVCIYRIPMEKSVAFPGSHCFKCSKPIAWYDNMPLLSYWILGGKCRNCKTPFSLRYFGVELLTAVLFLMVFRQYGLTWLTPIFWLVVFGLILGTFVDIDHLILPDRVTWGGIFLGLIISPLVPALHGEEEALKAFQAALGGACIGFGLLWLVAILGTLAFRKEAMGFGDVKLLGAVGAFMGWKGVLFTLVISAFAGSAVGLTQIALRQRAWQTQLPYGPFLAVGALVWIFAGEDLFNWYVDLLKGPPLY